MKFISKLTVLLALSALFIIPLSTVAEAITRAAPLPAVWFFGDSISAGQGLGNPATDSWVAQMSNRAAVRPVNWSQPGYAFSGYLGNISDELNTAYASKTPVPHTAVVAAGSNDLIIHDSNSLQYSEYAALNVKNSLLAHGVQRVIFAGIIPRGDGYDALRQQFNMWLALSFGSDYQPVGYFFNPVTPFPVQYYQAGLLHPNYYGATTMANTFDITRIIK